MDTLPLPFSSCKYKTDISWNDWYSFSNCHHNFQDFLFDEKCLHFRCFLLTHTSNENVLGLYAKVDLEFKNGGGGGDKIYEKLKILEIQLLDFRKLCLQNIAPKVLVKIDRPLYFCNFQSFSVFFFKRLMLLKISILNIWHL